MPPKKKTEQAAAAATEEAPAEAEGEGEEYRTMKQKMQELGQPVEETPPPATATKKPRKSRSAKPKKEPKEKKEKDTNAATKNKRQKKDPPVATTAESEAPTKSTLGTDNQEEEESKISSSNNPEEVKKSVAKKGRNRTKLVPSANAGDYIADSDDEEFKEAIAKIESGEVVDGEAADAEEDSELNLGSKALAAALDGAEDSDDEDGDSAAPAKAEETKEPKKAKKKKVEEKKTSKPAAKAADAKGKAGAEPNKHAKAQPTKVMMTEKEAKEAVSQYMEAQNRPYSLQNVMDNMHGRIHRKICQQVLDDLTDEKHLTCKEFGKAKIYMANQDKFAETSKEELAELDAQIAEKKKVLDDSKDRLKQLQAQLKDISSSMTNQGYVSKIAQLKEANQEAETRLKAYQEGGVKQVTEEEVDQVKADYVRYQKFWRVRRRGCLEIVDMICDSVDQNRKEFFESVGLESDADYGVNIGDFNPDVLL